MIRFFFIVLLSVAPPLHAEIVDSRFLQASPLNEWYTLQTEHFNITFERENKDYALKLAGIAEKQYAKLTKNLNWVPAGKTEIVVNDTVDFSNGASTVYPYNQFFVYMNEPVGGDLLDQIDFTETLFTHEYTHILHLDQATHVPARLRRIFGKSPSNLFALFVLPQVFAPHWLSEGVAIYQESQSGFGRNHSAVFEAKMREEVRTGLASFTEESYEGYYGTRWPFGQVYLYGAYFFQFLSEAYGEQTISDYIRIYNGNLIPWRMNNRAVRTTGKTARQLWQQFQRYLEDRFNEEIENIKTRGLTRGEIHYADRWYNRLLTRGPEDSVFTYHEDLKTPPKIVQVFPDGRTQIIKEIRGLSAMQWHPEQGLLLAKPEVCGNRALYTDVYRLDLHSKKLHRISHCARVPRADWAADGQSVYAVRTAGGKNQLLRIALNGETEVLDSLGFGEALGQPDISADGKNLLAAVKRKGLGWNLEIFDIEKRQWNRLTNDRDMQSEPHYAMDGEHILFVSNRHGAVELRSINKHSRLSHTLTNSLGYIHRGIPAGDGRIWVSEYTGTGDIVRRLDAGQSFGDPWTSVESSPAVVPPKTHDLDPEIVSEPAVQRYDPRNTLAPAGWAPVLAAERERVEYGLMLAGQDILGFHSWSIVPVVYQSEEHNHVGGGLTYSFNDRLILSATSSQDIAYRSEADDSLEFYEVQDNLQALLQYPINRIDRAWNFSVGTAWEKSRRTFVSDGSRFTTEDAIAGFAVSFNNVEHYPHAISRHTGLTFDAVVESFEWLGSYSDHRGNVLVVQSEGNLRFGDNQALIATLDFGLGQDGGKPFILGDSVESVDTISGITRLGKRNFSLRGYAENPALIGESFLRASLAWHFSVSSIYNGFTAPPLGLGRIDANVFTESGDAWDTRRDRTVYQSIGAELSVEFLIGYDALNLPVSFGFAHGLDEQIGEDSFYLRLNVAF